ncbi:cytochrome c peroxidase [Piscinibacter sp. XHJ-5]|uniref:cytochrome-c peroxidase n=1 Tax=Piscinibacter sp. XHJ-5 TaxID=3037797 RepID=UPI0024530640|nr:cytochrome c peroxidase [Piscinibacter sp. XHJ-5]
MPFVIRAHWTALAAATTLTLAACGGGGSETPADTSNATAAERTAQALDGQAAEHDALLEMGLPALIARRKPELASHDVAQGRRLFERETFGGNGRTCLTCHSRDTGTTSPTDAQRRFAADPADPLFLADGSDDGQGHGATRMQKDATVLVRVALPENVSLAHDPAARSVVLRRGIPSTLNTPALDDVLMLDGRQPDLLAQARGAIADHAQAARAPRSDELAQIAAFQQTPGFFSSPAMMKLAYLGVTAELPPGRSDSEKRGRRFFIDAPPQGDFKTGLCSGCHSGPMLNQTNEFIPAPPFRRGGRFQSVGVSEINAAGNPVIDFLFRNPDGTTTSVSSPDPGRALITGNAKDVESLNAFKIPSLWGVARTAPYFHDNSAKTLEDVARHYALLFSLISPIVLTPEDQADMVAYMKLLR